MFAVGVGMLMAAVFGGALFVRDGSSHDNRLVPARVLEEARQHQIDCQTTPTDETEQQIRC